MVGKLFVFLIAVAVLIAFGWFLYLLGVPPLVIALAALVMGLALGFLWGLCLGTSMEMMDPQEFYDDMQSHSR